LRICPRVVAIRAFLTGGKRGMRASRFPSRRGSPERGLYDPALLYEPEDLKGKVPVSLAVNGHDGKGKAADYKQMRCINMAKRGMLVLNVEWFQHGPAQRAGFNHYAMNQLDLCGTSGIAPYYLAMTKGLDILLSLPNADPNGSRSAVCRAGGWQTIFVSSLDTRVTLCNPVAGYSGFRRGSFIVRPRRLGADAV